MATAKLAGEKPGTPWLKLLLFIALVIGGLAWYFQVQIRGYAGASTAYAAKTVCSCVHIGGREAGQCKDDLLPAMALLWISEDATEKSVTARVPLVESTTATYREGPGCVLEAWDG